MAKPGHLPSPNSIREYKRKEASIVTSFFYGRSLRSSNSIFRNSVS